MAKRKTTAGRGESAGARAASAGAKHAKRSGREVRRSKVLARSGGVVVTEVAELEQLRRELERAAQATGPMKWNADPDEVQRSVAHLVLTLIEFVRRLLERQAIRRMEAGTLDDGQTEDVGRALMKLEETVQDIAAKFGIKPEELNLELGPVGKLM
jgi:hypothetical protein